MDGRKDKITVFTVNWNGRHWLEKFLLSLKKQSYPDLEVLIVDNASTDDSINFVEKNYPAVRIIKNKQNFGLAKATNIGVKASKGKYVLFINNDTWFESDFVEKLFNFYKNNDYTAVAPIEKRYKGKKGFLCNTTIDLTGSPAFYVPTYARPDKIFYLTVAFLCSKEDFITTGGMDNDFFMYYEDVDWFWRLTLLKRKFAVTKACSIYHAGAGSSGSGIKYNTFLWRNQNALQALIKNYSIITLLIVLPIYFLQNFLEIIFFLIRGRTDISLSYINGWTYNAKMLKRTLKKRAKIQRDRQISDLEVIKKMYIGFAKAQLVKTLFINKKILT